MSPTINQETMRSPILASCVALSLILGVPWVVGQPNEKTLPKLTVEVPFDFMIGQAMFPAGHYTVKPTGNRTFQLQAIRGRASLKFVTGPISTGSHPGATRLVFLQEDRHYQLRELWMNADTGRRIPGPRVEDLRTASESRVEVPATCAGCN